MVTKNSSNKDESRTATYGTNDLSLFNETMKEIFATDWTERIEYTWISELIRPYTANV